MTLRNLVLSLIVISGLLFASRVSHAVPGVDLRPEISNVTIRVGQTVGSADVAEGCAGGTENRTLIAFDHAAWNDGPGDLSLGEPGCPDCEQVPNPVCSNPLFECSLAGGHNHPHLKNFSDYSVTTKGDDAVIVRGHKEGFCLVNSICRPDVTPPIGGGSCNELSAGCADFYGSGLGCQYVDVSGLPPGQYTLRVELNPLRFIPEVNYLNNVQTYDFEICKQQRGSVDVKIGVGDPQYQNKRPVTLRATLTFPTERELRKYDPIKDGLTVILNLGGRDLLGYAGSVLPPGKVGKNCYPKDGWRKTGRSAWAFRSDSEMDPSCSYMTTSGVHTASVEKRGNKLIVSLRARVDPIYVAPVPTGGKLQVIIPGVSSDSSNDTCGSTLSLRGCKRGGRGKSLLVCR
jgi:hypothetical protein